MRYSGEVRDTVGVFAIVAILYTMVACSQPSAERADAVVMPKVEGCVVERYTVLPSAGSSSEIVYVARCTPRQTTSITARYGCGKSCVKNVTTITTIEGVPETQVQEPAK